MCSDRGIPTDVPAIAAVIEDLRFAVNYHETYGISRIANAARAAIEALETKERQSDSLDGYHPMVRDFLLGKGCFSPEREREMHERVGARIGKAAAEAMNEALLEAFVPVTSVKELETAAAVIVRTLREQVLLLTEENGKLKARVAESMADIISSNTATRDEKQAALATLVEAAGPGHMLWKETEK